MEPSNLTAPPSRGKGTNFFLVIFGIFILAFTGAAGYMFGYQQGTLRQAAPDMTAKITMKKDASSSAIATEVTRETKIATSLAVPKLDPEFTWKDITKTASDGGNLRAAVDIQTSTKSAYITFPVLKIYEAQQISTQGANFVVADYYSTQLEKSGWVTNDNSPYLNFKTFRIEAISADSSCGDAMQFLGYKNGFAQLISVTGSYQACLPPYQTNSKQTITYDVYISKPFALQSIVTSLHGLQQ
jgi:hypothetical protein